MARKQRQAKRQAKKAGKANTGKTVNDPISGDNLPPVTDEQLPAPEEETPQETENFDIAAFWQNNKYWVCGVIIAVILIVWLRTKK